MCLTAGFEEGSQFGAVAVDVIPAEENRTGCRLRAPGSDVNGRAPLGTELQVRGRPMARAFNQVFDMAAGDPLQGADQRMTGMLPNAREVDRVDPVRDLI
jgi:hypothetical protein